jgi:cytochrome c553
MRSRSVLIVVAACLTLAGRDAPKAAGRQSLRSLPAVDPAARETIATYCVTCHNQRMNTGGLSLDALDMAQVADHAEVWEKVVRKLETRSMPPQGMRRPSEEGYQRLARWLEAELDRAATAAPSPGRPMLHRLNRAEYANSVRDMLALEVDAAALLPADDSAYGFDNMSDVLGVSPSLQERYLSAAATISALAVGDLHRTPTSETYRVRQDLSQNQHIEGLPFGTVGGVIAHPTLPLDGEYVLQVKLQHTNFGNLRGLDYPHQIEITVDGERVHVATIGGNADLAAVFERPKETGDLIEARLVARVPLKAGPRAMSAAFIRALPAGDTKRVQPFLRSSADTLDWTGLPHIQSLTITGPFNVTGAGDTPSRRRIFICHPTSASTELPCAKQIIATLARRAYRRPVTGADVQPLLAFYQDGRHAGTFETGIERALKVILASPRFVFRVEHDPAGVAPGSSYPLSSLELATRLSFFLWSSGPDDELIEVASRGTLASVLDRQVRRMLADPKSFALVSNFAGQWLQVRNIKSVQPNSDEFPDFDDNLRRSFQREVELFFESIIREDRSVLDLLRADDTFLDERLARHYGVPGIYGSRFRRVKVADEARRGLLGKGGILALTSHAERTSPVVRGKWVLENLLGTPPGAPPPDVPALKENAEGQQPTRMRDQMAAHRANAVCASCHNVMDPIGFALENFDAVGAWRTKEPGGFIDATGQLASGAKVDGVAGLRASLLDRPDVFVQTMTEKMLTYALGRGVDYHDMPAVRAVVRGAATSDYRFSSIVMGIVNSAPFQMRMKAPVEQVK